MNERYDPNDPRSKQDNRSRATDPVTGAATSDPLAPGVRDGRLAAEPVKSKSSWPLLILLLAAVVVAMLIWMPRGDDASDTATQPAATSEPVTPPAAPVTPDVATPPAAMPAQPAPAADAPAAPATGTDPAAPATGTAPAAPATGAQPATPPATTP